MKKYWVSGACSLLLLGCADLPITINHDNTLHAQGDTFSQATCRYCDGLQMQSDGRVRCDYYCDKHDVNCEIRYMSGFKADPLTSKDGREWHLKSAVTISQDADSWRKIFESSDASVQEQKLKKEICSAPAQSLTQTFKVDFPDAPQGMALDVWAKTRQDLVSLLKIKLRKYYANFTVEPAGSLSCFEGNTVSTLSQNTESGAYRTVIDYQRAGRDIVSIYLVKTPGSSDLHIAFGTISVASRKFESWNGGRNGYNEFNDNFEMPVDNLAIFEDVGAADGGKRKLRNIHPWEVQTLSNHYVYMTQGRSISSLVEDRNKDWARYFLNNTGVETLEVPGQQSLRFRVKLDLAGFCKGVEPVYDLTTH